MFLRVGVDISLRLLCSSDAVTRCSTGSAGNMLICHPSPLCWFFMLKDTQRESVQSSQLTEEFTRLSRLIWKVWIELSVKSQLTRCARTGKRTEPWNVQSHFYARSLACYWTVDSQHDNIITWSCTISLIYIMLLCKYHARCVYRFWSLSQVPHSRLLRWIQLFEDHCDLLYIELHFWYHTSLLFICVIIASLPDQGFKPWVVGVLCASRALNIRVWDSQARVLASLNHRYVVRYYDCFIGAWCLLFKCIWASILFGCVGRFAFVWPREEWSSQCCWRPREPANSSFFGADNTVTIYQLFTVKLSCALAILQSCVCGMIEPQVPLSSDFRSREAGMRPSGVSQENGVVSVDTTSKQFLLFLHVFVLILCVMVVIRRW